MSGKICFVVLGHGSPLEIGPILDRWQKVAGNGALLFLHGGREEDFWALDFPDKIWVNDPRLRTKSHPVEKQSYSRAWQAAAGWLRAKNFPAVYWAEFDEFPAVPDLGARFAEVLEQEQADVLGRNLKRVDGSNDAHWLYHESDPSYLDCFVAASVREDKQVVLSMLGTGSFWRRKAFIDVADHPESAPCYLELFLPTMAHHLGYRVRDFGEQSRFIGFDPKSEEEIVSEIRAGAWTVHPVKGRDLWEKLVGGGVISKWRGKGRLPADLGVDSYLQSAREG